MPGAEKPKVCIASGGPSGEAGVSRRCAAAVYGGLTMEGVATVWLDLDRTGRWDLKAADPPGLFIGKLQSESRRPSWQEEFLALARTLEVDVVFPLIHGTIGEDGQLQALCEGASLAYVGSGPAASMRCYDKVTFKALASSAGLPVADGLCVSRARFEDDPAALAAEIAGSVGFPCIVKPSRSGSSLGLARVEAAEAMQAAVRQAFVVDEVAVVERP